MPMMMSEPPASGFAPSLEGFARTVVATFPREGRAIPFEQGGALWSPSGTPRCRLSVVRAIQGDARSVPLVSQGQLVGGDAAPVCAIEGARSLWLAPRTGFRLVGFLLDGETVLVREDVLVAFDESVTFDQQPFASELVQALLLSGRGNVILEVTHGVVGLEVLPGQSVRARAESLVALCGAVEARATEGEELLVITGDGVALLEG